MPPKKKTRRIDDEDDEEEYEDEKPRRTSRKRSVVEDEDEEYEEEDDDDDDGGGGGDEYDHGMSKKERKAMLKGPKKKGAAHADADEEDPFQPEDGPSWVPGGGLAPLERVQSITLRRAMLEKWLLEPFFEQVVRGCIVRIGVGDLYRAAEVVGMQEEAENTEFPAYMLGTRRTTKRLQLEFGESRQWYSMASISNQPFEELELRSWQQVLEVSSKPLLTNNQIDAKCEEINAANNHQYSEAEVSKRIEEERKAAASMGKPTALTTRQKMQQQHEQKQDSGNAAARPMKFQRNVLGQAIVEDHDD